MLHEERPSFFSLLPPPKRLSQIVADLHPDWEMAELRLASACGWESSGYGASSWAGHGLWLGSRACAHADFAETVPVCAEHRLPGGLGRYTMKRTGVL